MCDENSFRERRNDRNDKFYANASFITKKSFFRFIKGHHREEYTPVWPKPHSCVYPKANSYYAFHENTNPFTRFPEKCLSREYGDVKPHFEPPEEPYRIRDPYLETEAKNKYLESKPTCFVLLGKPCLITEKLATMIASSCNCILISPLSLINQEIQQGSENGKSIADSLKAGKCLDSEVIMNLIINRLNKRDIFHRGYIVEDLPLIPNEMLDYSSYINNSHENFNICSETQKENENSTLNQEICTTRKCIKHSNYENFISSQIEDIFTTWPIKPSIIIYAACPDEDVVLKRERLRLDPTTGRTIDTSLSNENIETLYFHNKTGNVSFELYQELMNEERMLDENHKSYLLKRPCDKKSNVTVQCSLYKKFAIPVIEKWILLQNPQNVIRVDARMSVSLMFETVATRLRTLPLQRVILPKKLVDLTALEFEGESPTAVDEFEDKSNEEAFEILANRETVSPLFPWRLSPWNFVCPVELTKGRTVEGQPNYAVRFMNKVFFLSSNEAVDLFIENPRTFLFPFSPRATCKIVVFGPKYSGKSDLCNELSRMLKGTVINVNELEKCFVGIDSDVYLSIDLEEKANMIVEAVQNVPKEEIDIEVWRDGGYIVDGMNADIDCWKMITEDSGIVFEDAILLFDEDPYDYLLSKWHRIHSEDKFEEECFEEGEEESLGLVEYIRSIQKFELNWNEMKEKVMNDCRNLIICNINEIDDVASYVMNQIQDRYVEKARIMSEEEKEREKDIAEYIAMTEDTDNVDEEEEEKQTETTGMDVEEDNSRFGDTNIYCPVALLKHNVFWRGKEEFSAIFSDKIYHLSSESALEEFLLEPQKLNLPLRKPLPLIPPLRISIIGPTGSGKTKLAEALSREYGLAHVNYFDNFTIYMKSRGMPAITYRDILISSDDQLEEVELPEDLNDEKYNSDTSTVQTFVLSYWKTGSILPPIMQKECLLRFFKGLYGESGVVLRQFPSCLQDLEFALENYAMPEVVLELRCDKDTAFERMMPILLSSWESKLEEKKRIEHLRYTAELEEYETKRDIWIESMLIKTSKQPEEYEGEYEDEEHMLHEGMEEAELTRYEIEEMWYENNPEPVLFTNWEELETAKERIEQEFNIKYENDTQKIDNIRSALEEESIEYIAIDGERDAKEVLLRVMRILDPYVRREVSTLERTYTIDLETAETLLDYGYYFLSTFGYWCPVQVHQNKIPLQMFLPLEPQHEIHAVIHRQFIYFLGGKDAQIAFLKNPLKYLEQDSRLPIVPFRLSIIGPPKCGKTSLAQRFARKYGVKVVTRGVALRYILKHHLWTNSAQLTESSLRSGDSVPAECIHRAVEMYCIDSNSVCQGFVLDGFPSNRKEFEDLSFLGLQPMLVLQLEANLTFCLDCLSQGDNYLKKPANFSRDFLAQRYAKWKTEDFQSWLENYTQNAIKIDASKSMWHVWTRSDEEVCSRYMIIRSYFRESDYDKVHSLKYMSVSPYEFKKRESKFESYCPLCLHFENIIRTSGPPPNHEGMVQFREHFYWICPQHINKFVENPKSYLPPLNSACLPENRPRLIIEEIDLEHPCWAKRLQIGGYCLVTYVENLSARKLVQGKLTTAILYKDKLYLLCSEDCRNKFLLQPDRYARVNVKFLQKLPSINLNTLPNLGYLEQKVATLIIKAVNQISVGRPKLPGLSPSVTAAIYIGVYLKIHNEFCSPKEIKLYKEAMKRIFSYERILKVATRTMKTRLNPFLYMPAYKNATNNPTYFLSGQLSVLSRIFIRPSSSIKFRRTSPTQILVDPDESSDE